MGYNFITPKNEGFTWVPTVFDSIYNQAQGPTVMEVIAGPTDSDKVKSFVSELF